MNNKYVEIFNYLRQCPQLSDLWSIAGTEDVGNRVILPQGASPVNQYDEKIDIYFATGINVGSNLQLQVYKNYRSRKAYILLRHYRNANGHL